jgi:cell shape-determining protein MreC
MNVIKKVQVFSIFVTKMRRGIKSTTSWVPRIYESVQAYMESMVEHLSSFFKDRELIAMFDE